MGMDVIDCGVAVLSMHSPFEVTSKVDIIWHISLQGVLEVYQIK